jgi:UDP-N-acetyl-D-glucosamine dehydrogenase
MEGFLSEFKKKVKRRQLKVAVVGLGYVGLPLAIEFAEKKFPVLGIEIDKDRLRQIKQKESYITDVPTLQLRRVLSNGHFTASGDFSAICAADVIIICVPTPLKRKYHPDISYIKQAIRSIARYIKKKGLIILESTTYPGTSEEIIVPLLESYGLRYSEDFYLCFSPERIDPGNKKYPVHKIPKIVGGIDKTATALARIVYANIIEKVVPVSSARVAEVAKLLENTFRLVNIGLVDELAMMAHKMGIDIWEVIEAAKTKPFGFMPFYPGPGVGGHCIPKDPLYLYWKARHHGFKSRFIKLASDVISAMPGYIVMRAEELLKKKGLSLTKAKVLVIGATYKKDIKDLRKSPALDIIDILQRNKIQVAYHDPLIPYLKFKHIDLKSIKLDSGHLEKFDGVIIATDHTAIDYALILKKSKLIFDARNIYSGVKDRKVVKL